MQSIVIISVLAYISVVGGMYMAQRSLMYHPDQTIPSPAEYNVPQMKDIYFSGHESVELHGWWYAPKIGMPTILYFHGNAGHIGDRAHKINNLISDGYGVLLMSYRYNANAQGKPSEDALIADGKAALNWLKISDVKSNDILIYGESLGSGIAVALASEFEIKGLILEAPYSSVAEVAQSIYWYLPTYWLVKDKFNSLARIERVSAPILIVHGQRDETIPVKFGQKLHKAAGNNAKLVLIDQAGHTDLYEYGMTEVVQNFIDKLD